MLPFGAMGEISVVMFHVAYHVTTPLRALMHRSVLLNYYESHLGVK